MTPDSPPARRAYRRLRVPAFYPVPVRTRRDGWTIERQADFLGMLAETGSVIGACEAVGISRKSAYQLRARPGGESFAAAWDAGLGQPVRRVTIDDLEFLAYYGLVRPRFRGGRYVGSRQKPDNSALLRLVSLYDRAVARADRLEHFQVRWNQLTARKMRQINTLERRI